MSDFVQNILARHNAPADGVQPRLRGRFEPLPVAPALAMPNIGEGGEHQEEHSSIVATVDVEQPSGDTFRQTSMRPLEEVPPTENFRANATPSPISFIPPLFVVPDANTPNVFSERAAFLPPVYLNEKLQQSPLSVSGVIDTQKQDVPRYPAIKKTEEVSALPGSGRSPLVHVQAGVQPAFAALEKSSPLPNGMLETGSNSQRSSDAGRLPEGFRRSLGMETKQAQTPAPIMKVNIGRIEVRALMQTAPTAPATVTKAANQPRLTLEDYLKKQNSAPR